MNGAVSLDIRSLPNLNARAFGVVAGPGGGKTTLLEQFFRVPGVGVLAFDPAGELARRVENEAAVIRVPLDYATREAGGSGLTIPEYVAKEMRKKAKICLDFQDWWDSIVEPVDAITRAVYLAGAKDLLLLCEECHEYIPQDGPMSKGVAKAFAAGRNWRWGRIAASQRPAEVNKKCLERCDTLFLGRLQGSRDALAVENLLDMNIRDKREREEVVRSMLNLDTGCFILREPRHVPTVNQ